MVFIRQKLNKHLPPGRKCLSIRLRVVRSLKTLMRMLASLVDRGYLSVVICFVVFLVNDAYGFISWCAIKKHQDLVLAEKDKTGD